MYAISASKKGTDTTNYLYICIIPTSNQVKRNRFHSPRKNISGKALLLL
ncbi:hypothetical protein POKO110462_16565 [Pontibacter korlensis]